MKRRSRAATRRARGDRGHPRSRRREPLRARPVAHRASRCGARRWGPASPSARGRCRSGTACSSCGCRPASGRTSFRSWRTRCARASGSAASTPASCAFAWARSRRVERPPERRVARAVPTVVRAFRRRSAAPSAASTTTSCASAIERAAAANLAWQSVTRPAPPQEVSEARRAARAPRGAATETAPPARATPASRAAAPRTRGDGPRSIALTLRNAL